MKLFQTSFYGDPNIGFYAKASDKFCIAGRVISQKNEKELEKYLDVEVEKGMIADTDFIGLFSAVNSNGMILPKIVSDEELRNFKQITKELGINLEVLRSRFTAVGNLILCNDKGAVVSKVFRRENVKLIEDCLDVEAVQMTIGGVDIVGASGIATNKGCLLHRDASEREIKRVENALKVETDIGTANFGSPFVSSCIISNSNGTLIGNQTTSPEMQRIIDTLKL